MSEINKPQSRTIYLNKNIDKDSAASIIQEITKINEEDDEKEKLLKEYTREPIKLILNSYGGVCYDGFSICAAIESSKTPVYTYVYGYAMSMGLLIASFGHKRYAHRLARFCYHGVSSGSEGRIEDIRQDLAESDNIQDIYDREFLAKTKVGKDKIDSIKKMKQDWFFTAEEALKYKVIDELIK